MKMYEPPVKDCGVLVNFTGNQIYVAYFKKITFFITGSRTEKGFSGFAGVIRNVYLCGEELPLSTIARREAQSGL